MAGCLKKLVSPYPIIAAAPIRQLSLKRFFTQFPVTFPKAAVISEEILASQAGLDVLRRGGNAADAVLAIAACMQVLQPYTQGVGGDCFALFYDARMKKVSCVDGSGRSPAALTLEMATSQCRIDRMHKEWVEGIYATVPGAVKAWFHIAVKYGSGNVGMSEIFSHAIHYAEHGFPMDHSKNLVWQMRHKPLLRMPGGRFFLDKDSKPPAVGATLTNQPLASFLRTLAKEGPRFFYDGSVAKNIVKAVRRAGGVLSIKDLADHLTSTDCVDIDSVCTTYRERVNVHTTPLPTQGAVLLESLNILDGIILPDHRAVPGEFEHVVIEALRHAVGDGLLYVADPGTGGSQEAMLSNDRARWMRNKIKVSSRMQKVGPEIPLSSGHTDTTFMAAVDETGNVCAMLGSNSIYFGCAVLEEHGFVVHTRGKGFSLIPGHPNAFGPRKKPYHTLMPVLVTDAQSHDWLCTMGTMGGLSQPSITLQVLLNLLELGSDPQQAVAKPRFQLGSIISVHPDDPLGVEAAFAEEALQTLMSLGHPIKDVFPRDDSVSAGHALVLCNGTNLQIRTSEKFGPHKLSGSLWCGVDPRCNGGAAGY
ncbi:glutathione hydrolase-like YwrD proenzyme isoform X2 [Haemaphysalis longicornis]